MIELTKAEIFSLGSVLYVGYPDRDLLWRRIRPVSERDLDMLMSSDPEELIRQTPDWNNPVEVRNWVAKYTKYVPDIKQWGLVEHWADPGQVAEKKGDDCDGLAAFEASIEYSNAVRDVRLTLGRYMGRGHMWVQHHPPGLRPRISETTGDDQVEELPLAEDHPEYEPWMQAERTGPHDGCIWVRPERYHRWQEIGWI
jgi:hypothetical protein